MKKPSTKNEIDKLWAILDTDSFDVLCFGGEMVEIETARAPGGEAVLYVHVNGVTKLRVSGYGRHKFSDKLKEIRVASLTDLKDAARRVRFVGVQKPDGRIFTKKKKVKRARPA